MTDQVAILELVYFKVGSKYRTGRIVDFLIDHTQIPKRVLNLAVISDGHYIHHIPIEDVRHMTEEELFLFKLENPEENL